MNNDIANNIIKRFNVQVCGTGSKTMLFAHGLACDQKVWRSVTTAFENDYKIVVFDYIGSGRSDRSAFNKEKYNSLYAYAADVIDICTALDLKDVIFVGHSVSSMIGVLAAVSNPNLFKCLIMIGPSPCYTNEKGYTGGFEREEITELLLQMEKNYSQWAAFFAPQVMGNEDRPALSEGLKESFCTADPAITLNFARLTFYADNRNDLPKVTIPSLIMQMAEDIIVPTGVGAYMHGVMPASKLVYMKATGHFPHISAPQETIAVINTFLEGLSETNAVQ
jgi:sigma-B regulation protein RsbQ